MAHALPLAGSPLRELFDVADLVAVCTGEQPLPILATALRSARATMRNNSAIKRVFSFALDGATDQVLLVSVGPRGGWKREWVFGPVPRAAKVI